jgi:hypothetical protein
MDAPWQPDLSQRKIGHAVRIGDYSVVADGFIAWRRAAIVDAVDG